MRTRLADLGKGVAAVVALVALLVGVPAVVAVAAGWPLPRGLPKPDEVRQALEDGWSPDAVVVMKVLAVVCWAAWCQIATCVVVEMLAVIRCRRAPTVPFAGWVQPLVSRLVGALFLLSTVLGPAPALAAAPPLAHAVIEQPPASRPLRASAPHAEPQPEVLRHVVVRRDTLWDLAERHLGDPFRYRELLELNKGRPQPDGRSLRDPHWIYPGWVLLFPADALGLEEDREAVAAPSPRPEPIAAPAIPALRPPPPPIETAPSAPGPQAENGAKSSQRDTPRRQSTPTGDTAAPVAAWGVALGAAGLAAAGVLAAIDRLRRRRQQRRTPGEARARPPVELEVNELRLRTIAREDAAEWLDAGLRMLTHALNGRARPLIPVLAARVGSFGVEFLLAEPDADAPTGFTAADEGNVWRLDPALELETIVASFSDANVALPALVTVGDTTDGPLLINVEAAGCLAVDGDPSRVEAVLAGVVLELATASWARGVEVHAVDLKPEIARLATGVSGGSSDELHTFEEVSARGAEELGVDGTTFAARTASSVADAWLPNVVVAGAASSPMIPLRDAAMASRGTVVAVVAGQSAASWRLVLDADGDARIEPLGIHVHNSVDLATVIETASLLVAAESPEPDPSPDREDLPEAVSDDAPLSRASAVPAEVEVSVLGPVEVDGWATPPARRKLTEVVVYLATHAAAVPVDVVRAAVWPPDEHGEELTYGSFKTAISRARAALGTDSKGGKHLPEARGGRYGLGAAVRCDWMEFRRLARLVAGDSNGDAIQQLREALELVRGVPFAGVPANTYGWAWSEQLVSEIEASVTDAAATLGELALERGDFELADWAARQGLRAVPGQEALYRLRLRAAAAKGVAGAVEQVYREAERAVRAFDPLDELSEETVNLFESLRAQRQVAKNGHKAPAPTSV